MSIVVDLNTFSMVFDSSNSKHTKFMPVKVWIDKGDGFLLFGGTKFLKELEQSYRHLRLVRSMRDAGQAIEINSNIVDKIEAHIVAATTGKRLCNDQHVMALLCAAGCDLLCSLDAESYPFVKDKTLYPPGAPKVRIYCSPRNSDLLSRCYRSAVKNART